MAKIQYNDKVNIISQPVPEVNKVTAANLNEIKTSVNINVDNIALNATDLSLKADISGNSSEIFKIANGLSANDAVNLTQLDGLETTLQNNINTEATARTTADTTLQSNIDLKVDIASIVDNVTSGGVSVPLSAEQGKILKAEILALAGSLIPQGNWDADTNTPDITTATETGYFWIVSVEGATDIGGITDWKVNDWAIKTASGWAKIDNTDKVLSVAGKIGEVVLAKADVGLSNVDNTTDANKPISTAQQTALDLKANKASPSFTGNANFAGLVTINNRLDLSDALNNTFIGSSVGENNTTGSSNAALGYLSLQNNTTGSGNVALGFLNLQNNTTGNRNVALGFQSLQNNTTGNSNVALGYLNLYENTTGSYNVALGYLSLQNNTTGGSNVALGLQSGRYIADGNTSNETGSESIFIGRDTRANADGETNQIVIGVNAIGNGSNTVTLGNSSITDNYFQGNLRASNFIGDGSALTNMPVSSAQQTALDLKANKASPSFTGDATFGGALTVGRTSGYGNSRIQSFIATTANFATSNFLAGDSANMAEGVGGEISFLGKYATGNDDLAFYGGIKGFKENATDNNTACALGFYTRQNATAPTERMRIKANGDFDFKSGNATFGGNVILDDSRIYSGSSNQRIILSGSNSTSSTTYQVIEGYDFGGTGLGGDYYVVINKDGTTPTNVFNIDGKTGNATFGGSVLINQTSSVYSFELFQTGTAATSYNALRIRGNHTDAVGIIGTGGSSTGNTAFRDKFVIGTQTAHSTSLATSDTARYTIDSSGNHDFKSGNATFGGNVTASSFVGTIQENFTYLDANYTLLDSDYNLHSIKTNGELTVIVPLGLGINQSWNFSSALFNINLTHPSGVTITTIPNGNANNLKCEGLTSARLVATSTANEYLFIKG